MGAGWLSPAFKREWKTYYGFDWKPQHESAENTYLANKLKYHLYYRALDEAFTFAKEYGASKGMKVRCYVPTHSLLNYSLWQIVSPEPVAGCRRWTVTSCRLGRGHRASRITSTELQKSEPLRRLFWSMAACDP